MSSSSPTPNIRPKKVLCPKVWKRPHSTIYGKNVEFGSSLYSDKIGELNGRKFNSELPWSVRNSGGSSLSSVSGHYSQGYLSPSPADHYSSSPVGNSSVSPSLSSSSSSPSSFAQLLESTNPNRSSSRIGRRRAAGVEADNKRIDFYNQYGDDFNSEVNRLENSSLMRNAPLLARKGFDNYLDFDHELGLFISRGRLTDDNDVLDGAKRSLIGRVTLEKTTTNTGWPDDINTRSFNPLQLTTQLSTSSCGTAQLLPKHHHCHLASSPYGQSSDGRKLSLGSINPQSYRPSLPQKTTTAHASDGEEFEFQDKSSPFYTDRWAGKTIRHFDSDLYSNANLFKSMIL